MRRRALLACLTAGLAALVAYSHVAGAQSVERIRIADPTRQQHQLPPGLLVELESPNEYIRQSVAGNAGRWTGPRWEEAGHPENAGVASLDWSVSFEEGQGDAEQLSQASVRNKNWVRDQRGGISPTLLLQAIQQGKDKK